MKLHNMLGYKFFSQDEDGVHLIRIVYVRTPFKPGNMKEPSTITIYRYDTDKKEKIRVEELKDYTPLEPDGVFTASIVSLRDNKGQMCKDVVCTAAKYIDLKLKELPYVVCRQSVNDIFYNLLIEREENDMVGCSVNRDTCPEGFDYRMLMMAEHIDKYMMINFYRNDTVEDILRLLPQNPYNEILSTLYNQHCKHIRDPKAIMKKFDKGWCKDIETLLKSNNFEADINQMLGITDVGFEISHYLMKKTLPGKDELYDSVSDDLRFWLSSIFKINITDITVLPYDHDIDIVEFKNSKYFFLRDSSKMLYLFVYNENGEFFEKDLEAKEQEYDFSTKFKIDFYNKYNDINKSDNIVQYI